MSSTAQELNIDQFRYHENLHIRRCGSVLSTYKKTGPKILRILSNKFSKIHYIISQKNQMRYLLGSKSHWIIGQKSRKFALYYRSVLSKKATLSNVTPKHCSIL